MNTIVLALLGAMRTIILMQEAMNTIMVPTGNYEYYYAGCYYVQRWS